jgi:hypothetical protein
MIILIPIKSKNTHITNPSAISATLFISVLSIAPSFGTYPLCLEQLFASVIFTKTFCKGKHFFASAYNTNHFFTTFAGIFITLIT